MIKITKYLYVHILTVILFAVCLFTHNFFELFLVYSVMLVHECAHLAAAAGIGLKVSHMVFYPFGVNLRLKNKMVYSLADEIILYASGPLCNALFALAAMWLYRYHQSYAVQYFYISNTVLCAVNLLPAVPLDGGIIVKKILSYSIGSKTADKIMRIISGLTALLLTLSGIYVVYVTKYNYSVLMLSALVVGNIFTQKEKYNLDYIKELMFYKDKNKKKVSLKIASEDKTDREISKLFDFGRYSVVLLTDKKGKVTGIVTETEIIDKIICGK